MRRRFSRRTISAVVVVLAVVALSGCGEDDGSSGVPSPSPTTTPTPSVTPGQAFTGDFAGTVALDAGRTGVVALNVQSNEQATGTLTISGGTTSETVPLTGFVALSNGDFSLSGSSADGSVTATVSGTLPGSGGGSGILVIQIGTNFFRGTISAA
jgi:hypothetical protein